ncbi:MAG: hypothetical protein IJ354_02830 [Clostridia bacterium]|nr:hypothetical protein [Clostridia bacterium]
MKRCLCLLMTALMIPASVTAADPYQNWYEIFVYSYQDSNGDGIGDLNGVRSRLDYIEQMGYTGIWLMPIMPSPSYHKYDVTDYFGIDSRYGTMEDFRALVQDCHERGIRLIIDMPLNHSSKDHPWFVQACNALREGRTDDPMVDYYCFSQKAGQKYIPVSGTDWYYEEQFSGGGMPDLNLDSAAVRAEIRRIFDFWLNDVGVDGFRLDAVTSYYAADTQRNVAFLSWLKQMTEELKPGSYLVGEAWTGLSTIAEYYQSGVDSFFLFPASQAEGGIAKVIRARSNPAGSYVSFMQQVYDALGDSVWAPFIGNHDTGRAVGSLQARSSVQRAKFAEGIVNMMGGATFTYYGEEIGMVGAGDDPNKRLAMYWNDHDMTTQPPGVTKIEYAYPCVDDQLADEQSLLNYCRTLNHLKLEVPSIARGKNEFVYNDANVCVMKRTWNGEESWIVINFSAKQEQNYCLEESGLSLAGTLDVNAFSSTVQLSTETAQITLQPYGIVVFVK